MDAFFNKLSELFKSFDSFWEDISKKGTSSHEDTDYREAWNELEEYLKTGHNERGRGYTAGKWDWQRSEETSEIVKLKQDYANLELKYGASFSEVRKTYKRLIKKYHPDRFISEPEKQRVATEITQKITASFHNIRASQRSR